MVLLATTNDLTGLCEAGRYREAKELIACGADVSLLERGIVEANLGDPDRAKDYLSAALAEGDARARIHLAEAYRKSGQTDEALILLRGNNEPGALLVRAIIQLKASPKRALNLVNKIRIDSLPVEARVHNLRGLIFRKLEQPHKAIESYCAAIICFEELESDCLPTVLNNLAGAYLEAGAYAEALEQVERAINLTPDGPLRGRFVDQRAQILLASNQIQESIQSSRQAINLLSSDSLVEALITLAKALSLSGDCVEAVEKLEQARKEAERLDRKDLVFDVYVTRRDLAKANAERYEKMAIELALELANGRVRPAAERLGIGHSWLLSLMKRYNLRSRSRPKPLKLKREND